MKLSQLQEARYASPADRNISRTQLYAMMKEKGIKFDDDAGVIGIAIKPMTENQWDSLNDTDFMNQNGFDYETDQSSGLQGGAILIFLDDIDENRVLDHPEFIDFVRKHGATKWTH